MDDKTSLSKSYSTYFILDEGKLRKLIEVLTEYSKKKDYECDFRFMVKRSDNSEYSTDSIETVLKDDNIKRKEIRELTILLKDKGEQSRYNLKTECNIEFSVKEPSPYTSPVKYSVKDENEKWAFSLAEELDAYISRTLVYKSKRFNQLPELIDNLLFPMAVFISIIFIINLIYPLNSYRLGDLNLFQTGIVIAICTSLLMLSFNVVQELSPIQKLSNLMNLNSVFYWGDQKETYDAQHSLRQNVKWVVIIGFLVSMIAGVLVTALL